MPEAPNDFAWLQMGGPVWAQTILRRCLTCRIQTEISGRTGPTVPPQPDRITESSLTPAQTVMTFRSARRMPAAAQNSWACAETAMSALARQVPLTRYTL